MIKNKTTRIEIFGSADDPEIKSTLARLRKAGHKVKLKPRPDYDTGLGPCGKHQCNCEVSCEGIP